MSDSFIAAVYVVVPMVLQIFLGWLFRVESLIDRPTMKKFDKLLFRIFMPLLLFKNIYEMDFSNGLAWREMIFVGVCLTVLFVFSLTFPKLLTKDGNKSSVVAQAVVRGNYILFGVAVSEALYGEGNVGAVVMLGVVVIPMINIFAAIILELNRSGRASYGKLFLAILKNPMIIGALSAFVFKLLQIYIPGPVWSVIRSMANSTTMLSFISLGVGLEMSIGNSDRWLLTWGVFLRMVIVPLVFMPLSIFMGFREQSLCAMMIVFAAPTAVSSYPMAVAMGADGQLAGQLVCATTITSVITIFIWTLCLKSFGLM